MIKIQENVLLQKFTTFGIGGEARYFVAVENIEELKEALDFAKQKNLSFFILAGGSNVLFADSGFSGLVIKIEIKKVEVHNLEVTAGAGVFLSYLINFCVEKNLSGMENMFGIPGTIGGAVRGNAGAFGTEIMDVIEKVEALNSETGEIKIFSKTECDFEYRESFFKKNKNWIILKATFKLNQGNSVEMRKMIQEILQKRNKTQLQNVKTAGSFFANPVVPQKVQEMFEKEKNVKCVGGRVPAGWLLDEVGLKGTRIGEVGTGDNQANYFINFGAGTFDQILQLSSMAKMRVRDEFGVFLKEEVEIVY